MSDCLDALVVDETVRRSVFWWAPRGRFPFFGPKRENAGDVMAPVVVAALLQAEGRGLDPAAMSERKLLTVGSVLHFARTGDVIWGSGVNGKVPPRRHRFEHLDVRSVRGPRTRRFLLDRGIACPEVFGDPALLLPQYFPKDRMQPPSAAGGTVFVPHLHDIRRAPPEPGGVHKLLPTEPWPAFVRTLAFAGQVVSSSLHGVVIAEAYGVPARLVRLSPVEDAFKFDDYYEGTGRGTHRPGRSIEEAIALGPEPPPAFAAEELLAAFPRDLTVPSGARGNG